MSDFWDEFFIDENGNPLFDQYGNPTAPPPVSTPTTSSFDDIMGRFESARETASGTMSESEFHASDEWKAFNTEIRGAITSSTDKDWLIASRDWQQANLDDEEYGDHYKSMSGSIQNRLDALNNPLLPFITYRPGGTTRPETEINSDRDFISSQAADAYDSLLTFQREQGEFTRQLADEIRLQREFAIPRLPERSGSFVAGGSSNKAGQARVGIPDLLIRY